MCTLYKGVPHGIAIINYTDTESKKYSFRGAGVFHHGQLHDAPFTCLRGDGEPISYSKFHKGRPAGGSYITLFRPEEWMYYYWGYNEDGVFFEEETDIGGCICRIIKLDK